MNIRKSSIIVLCFLFLITVFFILTIATKLEFSNDFERYFPSNDDNVSFFQDHKIEFLNENERTSVIVKVDNGIFNETTVTNIVKLSKSIKKLKNVNQIVSPTELKYIIKSPFSGYIQAPYLSIKSTRLLQNDSLNIVKNTSIIGTFIAADFSGFIVTVLTPYNLSPSEVTQLKKDISKSLEEAQFTNYYFGGQLMGQAYLLNTLKYETSFFTGLAALLIVCSIGFMYRSAWPVGIAVAIVLVSIIWTLGAMALFGKPLDILSSVIPAILCAIGISDFIHVYQNFIDGVQNGLAKLDAIKRAYKEVGYTTLLTSITTIIGFLSLLSSSLIPLREFGIYTALGVTFAYILTYSLLPSILVLIKIPTNLNATQTTKISDKLRAFFSIVFGYKKTIYLCFIALGGFGIWSLYNLEINNYLVEEISESNDFRKGYNYVDSSFSGMRPFEIAIFPKDKSTPVFINYEVLKDINKLENYIKKVYNTSAISSVTRVYKMLHEAETNTFPSDDFPSKESFENLIPMAQKGLASKRANFLISRDKQSTRIFGLSVDLGGKKNIQLNEKIREFAKNNCLTIDARITGMPFLIDANNQNIVKEMLIGLCFAFLLVSLIIAIIFKSLRLVFIALIPNILPLLMICGFMYIFGINLNVSTALIFAISFGIAVDDTIHFLSKLKLELNKGVELHKAIEETFVTTGKAIVVTSIILFIAFFTLAFSEFTSSHHFGILVSVTILFAVISDLLILPLLLTKIKVKHK